MTRVGVDVGGTFTDLVAVRPDGSLDIRKVASTPADPSQGVIRALEALGSQPIDVLIHGTTVATNALLERRGARVALVTTAGFEDMLWLRRQDRAALYDLARDHPPPLVRRGDVVGVRERMGPDGAIEPLSQGEVARVRAQVRTLAPDAVAIGLLFAFRHPAHEQQLAAAIRAELPGVPVAASHEVLPLFREYERTSTTVAEAYLRPKVSSYVRRTAESARKLGVRELKIMTSSGGTLAPAQAEVRAAGLALSGPAGGVVGASLVGAAVGVPDLLTLDMGGTSADASLITGGAALTEGAETVAGIPLALPAILIETVSAGGGSIAAIDEGGALRVGPRSAGAEPGPACYGRGGTEPTVTDACLLLGWLDPDVRLADAVRLDRSAAERAIAKLGADVVAGAAGIVQVATAVMARALKRVSVARGIDPRGMALLPFGGAGALFGCALAESLGMTRVVIPAHPGVLSALGLAVAPERVDVLASVHRPLAEMNARDVGSAFEPLVEAAATALPKATLNRYADCRFAGQGYEVTVPAVAEDPRGITAAFHAAHRARYGHADSGGAVELVNLRVVAERPASVVVGQRGMAKGGGERAAKGRREIVTRARERTQAQVWSLGALAEGTGISGPAILAGSDATALVETGWRGVVHSSGAVLLERA